MSFNHRIILKIVSVTILFEGIAMLIPMGFAVYFKEISAASSLFFIAITCIGFGATIFTQMKYYTLNLKTREGFFIAFVVWLLVSIIGSLPFFYADCGYSFIDCFFESVAGWTTTGCYVIDIDIMPKSLVVWKCLCHWLGGMGILILTVSLFPVLGIGGQKVAAAEIPGPKIEKVSTRIADTAKAFYKLYVIFTLIELVLLKLSGMSFYDALINTLCTISTAGICPNSGGILSYMTPYVKTIICIFSVFASINFMIFFMLINGNWKNVLKNVELRAFLGIILVVTTVIATILLVTGTYTSFGSAISDSLMQTISFSSTSGFHVVDYNIWPTSCKMLLLMLMFIGGCSASTSGSLKTIRFVVMVKLTFRGIYKRIHPHSIKPVMLAHRPVSPESAASITVFVLLFFAIYVFSCVVLSLNNLDMETTLSAAISAFSNTGSGFGIIGTNGDFSAFSELSRFYCSILMLAGRLEMYAIVIMLSRSYWNSDRARS